MCTCDEHAAQKTGQARPKWRLFISLEMYKNVHFGILLVRISGEQWLVIVLLLPVDGKKAKPETKSETQKIRERERERAGVNSGNYWIMKRRKKSENEQQT